MFNTKQHQTKHDQLLFVIITVVIKLEEIDRSSHRLQVTSSMKKIRGRGPPLHSAT